MAASGFDPSILMSLFNGGGSDSSNGGGSMGSGFGGGLQQFLGGLTGHSGRPFQKGMEQFQKYSNEARATQNPFYNAGTGAIPQMQSWLSGMSDPSSFINNLMSKYQESPMAHNLQQASMRAGTNAASADGTIGSTPFAQQMQQNAGQISSMDQNNWLQNVLGVNNRYGEGVGHMMDSGQHAADQISALLRELGINMGQGAYGREAGKNQDHSNLFGGLINMFTSGMHQ